MSLSRESKVLIACPTWSGGEYALKAWADSVKAQTYPHVGYFMVDNSEGDLHYTHLIRQQGIECTWLTKRMPYLWDTMELCWVGPNGIVEHAHHNGYDFILSLEHDVVIPPDAVQKMLDAAYENAVDGKPAVVSHKYHPRGQEISDEFAWDTLGCTLFPTAPLYEDRLLSKATYEIECFIVCKRHGYPRLRTKDLFEVKHLKDPNDTRNDKYSATPAYDLYAKRKMDYAAQQEEPKEEAPEPKQIVPEPAKLVGRDPVTPAEPELKIRRPVPEAGTDSPVNIADCTNQEQLASLIAQKDRLRLNLGCGYQQIAGFVGVDFDESLDPDVVSPITDLSWLEDNTVDMIYASHCLEHLTMDDSKVALREWLRVLKPAGWLDVMVPDINQVYLLYKKGSKWGDYSQPVDENYINATAFGANLLADAIPEMADTYGGPGHQHKQIFVGDMLVNRVLECGFVEVHEVTQCFLRPSAIGEVMVQARKAWFTTGSEPLPNEPPLTKEKPHG